MVRVYSRDREPLTFSEKSELVSL